MIVVIPDAFTKYSGSMFSNSPTTGDWETFIAQDLTTFIDKRYRTIASREGRGLAGHSMGGYGTMRIGMKQPGSFAALYAMSSCCLMNDPAARGAGPGPRGDAPRTRRRGGTRRRCRTRRRTWSRRGPRRRNGQRPVGSSGGLGAEHEDPAVLRSPDEGRRDPAAHRRKWIANSPLVMVDQYVPALKSMRAIALDVGNQDPFVGTNTQLAESLTRLGVTHTFEVYDGDHGNRIRERFESQVLRFFSQHLSAR